MVTISQYHAEVVLGPYMIVGFMPQARPELAALGTTYCDYIPPDVTDPVSDALSVDLGSTSRWLADPAKLTDAGDGTWHWATSAGTDTDAFWEFPAANVCTADATYHYHSRHGRLINKPAFLFRGDMWAQLRSFADPLTDCTIMLAARLRHPNEAHRAGIVESRQSGSDPANQSDIYFRLRRNHIRSGVKGHHRQDKLVRTRRPQVVGVSHATNVSRLIVLDNHRRIHEYHHPVVAHYDMTWYLGRVGGQYDADTTLVMDLLELNVWDHALTRHQLRHAAHQLNGIYRALA